MVTPHPGVEPRIWYHIRAQKHGDVPFLRASYTTGVYWPFLRSTLDSLLGCTLPPPQHASV